MKPSFLPPLSRKMSLSSHNVNFRDLGCMLNAPPLQKTEILVTQETSLSHVLGPGARKLEFSLIDHMVSFAAL